LSRTSLEKKPDVNIASGSGDPGVQNRHFRDFSCFWPFLRPILSESRIRNGIKLHGSTRLFMIYIRLSQHFHVAQRSTEVSAIEVDPYRVYRVFAETAGLATAVSQ